MDANTTNKLSLRTYQNDALDALYAYFHRRNGGNPLVCMPTGSGKSIVIAAFIKRALDDWPETRIIVATHVKELIEQNHAALLRMWPDAPAGIYSAGLGRRDSGAQILFAGIQSIHKHSERLGPIDLILIDEAHLVPSSGAGRYQTLLAEARSPRGGSPKVVGFTATPYRYKSGPLTVGGGKIFDSVAYNVQIGRLVDEGWLSPLTTAATVAAIDTSKVSTVGGEFNLGELAEASIDITETIINELIQSARGRKKWLVFCVSVQHTRFTCNLLRMRGVSAEFISGDTPSDERADIVAKFRAGEIQALCNCMVLTTGFDVPDVDCLALLRPTKSTGLYVQMVGRGMRTADGKKDCLVLDYGENIERHGPVNAVQVKAKDIKETKGNGPVPTKVCEQCLAEIPLGAFLCIHCGHIYGRDPTSGLVAHAAKREIMIDADEILNGEAMWEPVDSVSYRRHQKAGRPDSMRVEYWSGMRQIAREWICFEHGGFASDKAYQWWDKRDPSGFPPVNTDVALEQSEYLPEPLEIKIKPDGQYTRIVDYKWEKVDL